MARRRAAAAQDDPPGEAPAGGDPLEVELATLQRLPPDGFTAARDALARRLRAEGRRDDAAAVKARRRPTVVAWAADQLALRTPEALDELFTATDVLAQAQEQLLAGGDRDALRRATAERRAVVDRLARTAGSWLVAEGVADAAHLEELAATLEAAAADPDVGAELRQGLLEREQAAPSGFGLGLGLGSPPAAARRAAPAPQTGRSSGRRAAGARREAPSGAADEAGAEDARAADEQEAEERRQALDAAAEEARAAADAATAAAAAAEAARATRDDAAADVAALEERLAAARTARDDAEADLAARRDAAERAAAAAEAAEDRHRAAVDAAAGDA